MMLIALYVWVRGSLLSASLQSRRVAAGYVSEAGLAEALNALETSNLSLNTGSVTGTLSSGGNYRVAFKDSAPYGLLDSVNNLEGSTALGSHKGPETVPPWLKSENSLLFGLTQTKKASENRAKL